ncbi:MAG: hypothetical protein MPJ24_10345 [Pirellulaceae bacterium]|nr:hypothetical protein [Pirellulaceae bacterium]
MSRSPKTIWLRYFTLFQIALFASVGCYLLWYNAAEKSEQFPSLREEPIVVRPQHSKAWQTQGPFIVDDNQLKRVLQKLVLLDKKRESNVGHIDHAIRFRGILEKGPTYAVTKKEQLYGEKLRQLMLHHPTFNSQFGLGILPLLQEGPEGVRFRTQEGVYTSTHVDHTMACLAEVGTPLSHPIVLPSGKELTFGDVVLQSLADFSLNQEEYEWSAMTYALFLPPVREWKTTEGQMVSFDLMCQRLMRQKMPQGVCLGNHRIYSLVLILRVDEQQADEAKIISPETRQQVMDYLLRQTQILSNTQHPNGFWNANWPFEKPPSPQPATEGQIDTLGDRLLATGHILEWWAMAPEELRPEPFVVKRASQWMVKTIDSLTEEEVVDYYTYLSHAGRALALWRGQFPEDFLKTYDQQKK